jgi:hypothetical protein
MGIDMKAIGFMIKKKAQENISIKQVIKSMKVNGQMEHHDVVHIMTMTIKMEYVELKGGMIPLSFHL